MLSLEIDYSCTYDYLKTDSANCFDFNMYLCIADREGANPARMADTNETDLPPQTNGIADNVSDEGDRSKMRPADIDAVSCK